MTSTTNWFDLTRDLKCNILERICVVDMFENAQKVCTDFFQVSKDPSVWRVINMSTCGVANHADVARLEMMCKHAVDRSQGQLVDFTFLDFGIDDELLLHVSNSSSQLKHLIISCGDLSVECFDEAFKKFPLLEELGLYSTNPPKEAIEIAGRYCPLLKTLIVNREECGFWNAHILVDDEIAISIGENLQELRHLKLIANGISNAGLQVIMNGCPHLESLDLGLCSCIDLNGEIVKRCLEQIKCLLLPVESDDRITRYDPEHLQFARDYHETIINMLNEDINPALIRSLFDDLSFVG